MSAESIIQALGGRRAGSGWTARCPAHEDNTPSISIRIVNGNKVLVHCHAGCPQARIIDALRERGLWSRERVRATVSRTRRDLVECKVNSDNAQRTEKAMAIWHGTTSAIGTLVATYLVSRGIHLPPPESVRFHAGLKHTSGGLWPVMVALVNGADGSPIAVHRTFLARDGGGKAPVDPQKMMLGPCRGGAVRLASPGEVLMVGEGIETCLAAMQATGNPAWAALSTSGLRTLNLPKDVKKVIVLADGDDAGEAAARDCALRWKHEGRRVCIARPPRGVDFNDMLWVQSSVIKEEAQ
jgi:putative DNA primase/helicase